MSAQKNYWLMKSEPDEFSIDDLKRVQVEPWTGVRNYQARNYMHKDMRPGDPIFFYHSNHQPPGIAGIAEVASEPYADPTQFDQDSDYYDPKSTPEKPRWFLVDVRFVRKLKSAITLETLKSESANLDDLVLLRRGTRLSVLPVSAKQWRAILKLEKAK